MIEIQEEISKKPDDISKLLANKRSLSCILDCQTLIRRGKFCSHVEIPADFQPKLLPDMTQIIDRSKSHYETWVASRYFSNKTNQSFPSFSAVNSFFFKIQVREKLKLLLLLFYHMLLQNTTRLIPLCAIFKMFFSKNHRHMVPFGVMREFID